MDAEGTGHALRDRISERYLPQEGTGAAENQACSVLTVPVGVTAQVWNRESTRIDANRAVLAKAPRLRPGGWIRVHSRVFAVDLTIALRCGSVLPEPHHLQNEYLGTLDTP